MFAAEDLKFAYGPDAPEVLDGVDFYIPQGCFAALIGANAGGKSTLAKLLTGLLLPSAGKVTVAGMDSRAAGGAEWIRQRVGLVFQNPDDQIVATVVEEDVAFGLGNAGLPPADIRRRTDEALRLTGLYEQRLQATHTLSGGQKQQVVLAGVLALCPQGIILDEATARLDTAGRRALLRILLRRREEAGLTALLITHHMEEAVLADQVLVLHQGRIALDGSPADIFSQVERLRTWGLAPPALGELMYTLARSGCPVPAGVYDWETCRDVIYAMLTRAGH
jgi:energy-coupling factor transport system ATP-binding protein